MAATHRARRIETLENKTALLIDIFRAVEVLAELADTDEERQALLLILKGAARLKAIVHQERTS